MCWFQFITPRTGQLPKVSMISIVDDDDSVRSAVSSLMKSLGYVAHGFDSAEDFLQSPNVNDTSCLIVDVQMPGMNGLELQRTLIAKGHRIPVIFISALPEERVRAQALSPDAICFLRKPFNAKMLIDCLETTLRNVEASH
jgi:FixJ family two-component response regulator